MSRNPEEFELKFETKPKEEAGEKAESLESFLNNHFKKRESNEIREFFQEEFIYFKDLKIEMSGQADRNAFEPKENKIYLSEVDTNTLKHELSHALVENKYNIFKTEKKFLEKFNISKEDISEINKLANEKFTKKFDEAYNFFDNKRKEVLVLDMEEKLMKKGMDKDEIRLAVDYYKTQKLLQTLKEYREFVLSAIEKKFGKEAAGIEELFFDTMGNDEIIGHALSNDCFGLDLIGYKFIDVKEGSKDILEIKRKIEKEGYFPVLEKFIGEKVEIIKSKLNEKTEGAEGDLEKARREAEEAFEK